jgi:hypothetical protein
MDAAVARSVSRFIVRAIFGISCLLIGFAMLACRVESSAERGAVDAKPQAARWVRTSDGWERADSWRIEPVRRARLHPLVVAAGEGLFSVLALVAATGVESRGTRDESQD